MRCVNLVLLALTTFAIPAAAHTIEESLLMLDPEERAHQVCILKGMDVLKASKRLPKADRLKTSIFSRATFDGTVVKADGGAVRSGKHWYALKFTGALGKDQMPATSFVYEVGGEIPADRWEDLNLW